MSTHKRLSPSAAHRWLLCSESLTPGDWSGEDQSSPQAIEGTAAHEFAACCLLCEDDAWTLIGRKCNGVVCTPEMAGHIQVYLDYVRSLPGNMFVEQKLESKIHPDLGGTADCLVWDDTIHVIDFKYGQGLYVDEQDNEQLMLYGLMACDGMVDCTNVRITIIQPRAGGEPIRHADYTAGDLYKWRDEVLLPAIQAEPAFNAGAHCKFCARGAALRCPLTMAIFETYAQKNGGPISDEELDAKYEMLPVVKEVQRWVEAQMFKRLSEGYQSGAAKLVQGKADRVWKNGAEEAAKALGSAAYTVPELKSPARIEKDCDDGKDFVTKWAYKPDGKVTVAPLTDKRARTKVEPPVAAFAGLKGEAQ